METYWVISHGAELAIAAEIEYTLAKVIKPADKVYDINEIGATISTFKTAGMVIVPCSAVAECCLGYGDNLLLRAANVTIKEDRNLDYYSTTG